MKELNKFQKNNIIIIDKLSKFFSLIDKKLCHFFESLIKFVLLLVGVGLMLASSIPIIYVLCSIPGLFNFEVHVFLKLILLSILCWYVGYTFSNLEKIY